MVTIGDLTLLETYTLLIPSGDEVSIPLEIKEDDLTDLLLIKLIFIIGDDEDDDKSMVKVDGSDDGKSGVITFKNWNKKLGVSMRKPAIFGASEDGKELFFLATVRFTGSVYELTIQFMSRNSLDEQ